MAENGKRAGCMSIFVSSLLYVAISIGVFYLINNGTYLIGTNNVFQREASVMLNDAVDNAQALPVGEYVGFDARFVVGPFASMVETRSYRGSDSVAVKTNEEMYYYAILEDGSIMALKSRTAKEIEQLNRMSDWLLSVDGYPMDGETLRLNGKLTELKDKETIQYFEETLYVFGEYAGSPNVRYLLLDTTAGRELVYAAAAALIVAIVLIAVLRSRAKKREEERRLREQAAAAQQDSVTWGWDQNDTF